MISSLVLISLFSFFNISIKYVIIITVFIRCYLWYNFFFNDLLIQKPIGRSSLLTVNKVKNEAKIRESKSKFI